MSWWAVGAMAVSTAVNLYGQNKSKKAGKADAAFEASQRMESAQRSRAMGQREAAEERRQSRLLESSLQARAGGGGLDPTIAALQTDIAGEGEYRALAALYEGETGALGQEMAAGAGLRTAKSRASAANAQMGATLFSSASQMYGRYAS